MPSLAANAIFGVHHLEVGHRSAVVDRCFQQAWIVASSPGFAWGTAKESLQRRDQPGPG